jgi:hypothetical protein
MDCVKNGLQMTPVALNDSWFEVYNLGNSTYAISEPYHFQEVISYLILGDHQSLLWDTGMNIADIRRVVDQLTKKPLIVVNSHVHFDHIGNNSLFDQVYAYDLDASLMRYRKGYSNSEMKPQIKHRLFSRIPEDFDAASFHIPPSHPQPVKEGHLFRLGAEIWKSFILRVILPTVSCCSIEAIKCFSRVTLTIRGCCMLILMVICTENQIFQLMQSHWRRYARLSKTIKTIHPSHNNPVEVPDVLCNAAEAMRALAENRVTGVALTPDEMSDASLPDDDEQVEGYVIPEKLYKYEFNGFSIIAGEFNSKDAEPHRTT